MRLKLGHVVASLTVSSALILGVGVPAGAALPTVPSTTPTTVTPATVPPTTIPPTTIPPTTVPPTTVPPIIDGPIRVGNGDTVGGDEGGPATPQRGTSVQLEPPPPAPTTTTTTLPPIDYGLPANSGSGFRVVYSKSLQKVWVVNSANSVIKEHRVSGRQKSCDPAPGTYSVYSRSRYTFAINNPALIWGYMVRFAKGCDGGNIGFHEIPVNKNTGRAVQSVSQLGQPLSGGCVRQAADDAVWMWNNIGVGTTVVVLP